LTLQYTLQGDWGHTWPFQEPWSLERFPKIAHAFMVAHPLSPKARAYREAQLKLLNRSLT